MITFYDSGAKYNKAKYFLKWAQRALTINLVKDNNFEELIELHAGKDVNYFDECVNSLLM